MTGILLLDSPTDLIVWNILQAKDREREREGQRRRKREIGGRESIVNKVHWILGLQEVLYARWCLEDV